MEDVKKQELTMQATHKRRHILHTYINNIIYIYIYYKYNIIYIYTLYIHKRSHTVLQYIQQSNNHSSPQGYYPTGLLFNQVALAPCHS